MKSLPLAWIDSSAYAVDWPVSNEINEPLSLIWMSPAHSPYSLKTVFRTAIPFVAVSMRLLTPNKPLHHTMRLSMRELLSATSLLSFPRDDEQISLTCVCYEPKSGWRSILLRICKDVQLCQQCLHSICCLVLFINLQNYTMRRDTFRAMPLLICRLCSHACSSRDSCCCRKHLRKALKMKWQYLVGMVYVTLVRPVSPVIKLTIWPFLPPNRSTMGPTNSSGTSTMASS